MEKHCHYCGREIQSELIYCPNCGCSVEDLKATEKTNPVYIQTNFKYDSNQNNSKQQSNEGEKSKVLVLVLGIFCGYLGMHNFYLGRTGRGIAQLTLTFISCGFLIPIVEIWAICESLAVLTGTVNKDKNGKSLK